MTWLTRNWRHLRAHWGTWLGAVLGVGVLGFGVAECAAEYESTPAPNKLLLRDPVAIAASGKHELVSAMQAYGFVKVELRPPENRGDDMRETRTIVTDPRMFEALEVVLLLAMRARLIRAAHETWGFGELATLEGVCLRALTDEAKRRGLPPN